MSFLRGSAHGTTDAVIESLIAAGITSSTDFLLADPEALAQGTECSYRELQSLRQVIVARHAALPVRGDLLLKDASRAVTVYSTGLPSLDIILGGGILGGEILELCGGPGAGKTGVCVSMAVTQAAAGCAVLYMDTAAALMPSTVMNAFANNNKEATEEALRLMEVCHPTDLWDAITTLSGVLSATTPPKLVVVDAVTTFMMTATASTQGAGAMAQLSSALRQLSSRRGVAVLVVAGAADAPGNAITRMWQHVPHIRVELQQGRPMAGRVTKATRLPTSGQFSDLS